MKRGNGEDDRVPLAFASDGWALYEEDVMDDEGFAEAAVERWRQSVDKWLTENGEKFSGPDLQARLRMVALKGAELLAITLCEGPEVRRQLAMLRDKVTSSG